MTNIEKLIEKLRTQEGNAKYEAYQLELKAAHLRTEERVYREAWQALSEAAMKDSPKPKEGGQ